MDFAFHFGMSSSQWISESVRVGFPLLELTVNTSNPHVELGGKAFLDLCESFLAVAPGSYQELMEHLCNELAGPRASL